MTLSALGTRFNQSVIHGENPFSPVADDPVRRFRGRLVAPVTIITSGDSARRAGLTVSSLWITEGETPRLHALVGPNSDLYDQVQAAGKFVAHICETNHDGLAEVFAGLRPSPGGLFAGLDVEESDWGPVLVDLETRAYCTFASIEPSGWTGQLIGTVDRIEVGKNTDPLVHFRGRYRKIE